MVFEKVRQHLVDILLCNEEDIKPESEFGKDIMLDSVDLDDLMVRLEEEFGIAMKEDDAFNVKTVADVVSLVESKLK